MPLVSLKKREITYILNVLKVDRKFNAEALLEEYNKEEDTDSILLDIEVATDIINKLKYRDMK